MGWILELFLGLCALTLCGGITVWIMGDGPQKFFRNSRGAKARLDQMDRRMTDVQDVMIALSEKFDRWERERISL